MIYNLLRMWNLVCLSESWEGAKFSVSYYNMVNRVFQVFLSIWARQWLTSSMEKQACCPLMAGLRQHSVLLHFLVVTIPFVLWVSDKLLVCRYLYMLAEIQEDQVFRWKSIFFLNVKAWMSSHDLRKWRKKSKEELSFDTLKIQTFHLGEIHLELLRVWQSPQNNICFDDRWGIGKACGCLLF